MSRRRGRCVLSALLLGGATARSQETARPPAIADNSFLIEEAYNQERGVVQHISTLLWLRDGAGWVYAFTQEWPLGGQRSQLSFTLPVARAEQGTAHVTRIGDVALNYRYQLVGTDSRASIAPRLTVLAPTGSAAAGVGAGGVGLQLNVPVSVEVAPGLVTHWNAGATLTPSARDAAGDRATTTAYNIGGSAIWRPHAAFNVMFEVVWTHSETVIGPGVTARERQLFVSPGVRWAHNVAGGLQIVPGIAFPLGVGPNRSADAVLLYLSFEHPFRKTTS